MFDTLLMIPFMPFVFLVVGLIILIYGGNWTVNSAIFIAKKKGIPPLLVGFTVVALGTSLPELIISIMANLEGSGGIALGNVIGSNIANIALILGLTGALYPMALKIEFKNVGGDIAVLILSSLFLAVFLMYGTINAAAGVPMILFLTGYIFFQYHHAKRGDPVPIPDIEEAPEFASTKNAGALLIGGLLAVSFGARILIDGAEGTAMLLGVPDLSSRSVL